jgi:large subunit ribosomal protein L35
MKTNRAAAKRFSRTGSGKLKRHAAFKRHILTKKSTKRKRGLGKSRILSPGDTRRVRILLPY